MAKDKTTSLNLVFIILSRLLVGKNPPEEIIVIDKLKESNVLIFNNFNVTNIKSVKIEYKTKILNNCLSISVVLNEIKLVNDFFKFSSKISINNIIENKK